MTNLAHKSVWRMLFISYMIACYCSRIPSYFVDWQKGLPSEGPPPGLVEGVILFVLAPIYTPIALFVETYLSFAWGAVIIERLLPLFTFTIVAVLSWSIMNAKIRKLEN
jgi:hypothetical protein